MVPKAFVAVMKDLEVAKERHAVWREVVDYLRTFVDSDVALAKAGIALGKDTAHLVPQPVINEIIDDIVTNKIAPIVDLIHRIEHWEIKEAPHELGNKKDVPKKEAPAPRRAAAKPRPVRPPSKT